MAMVGKGSTNYLRTQIITYMLAQSQYIAAYMLHTFESLHDVSVEYKTKKRGSGKETLFIEKGKRIRMLPDKMLELKFNTTTLKMFQKQLEDVLSTVANNGRFIANSAGPKVRKKLTVKHMMMGHAIDKRLVPTLNDGMERHVDENGCAKEYDWQAIRTDMCIRAFMNYQKGLKIDDEHGYAK